MDVLARNRNKHSCLGFCLKPSIGSSYRKVLSLSTYRSEGFARAAYFVPGCDGAGVWQDSEILPAPSLLESQQPPKRHILGDG